MVLPLPHQDLQDKQQQRLETGNDRDDDNARPHRTDRQILSQAAFTATIDAAIGKIDIADWLRTLPDREYQRCAPPDHKAAGYTTTDDGRPMSINVEMIGTGLVVQHYTYETAGKDHCHMVSISDVLTPSGWTTVQVIWDLKADPIDDKTSKYTKTVTQSPDRGVHGLHRPARPDLRGGRHRPAGRIQ